MSSLVLDFPGRYTYSADIQFAANTVRDEAIRDLYVALHTMLWEPCLFML